MKCMWLLYEARPLVEMHRPLLPFSLLFFLSLSIAVWKNRNKNICVLITPSPTGRRLRLRFAYVCYRVDLWWFVCNFYRCCGDTPQWRKGCVYVQMKTNLLLLREEVFMGLEIFAWVRSNLSYIVVEVVVIWILLHMCADVPFIKKNYENDKNASHPKPDQFLGWCTKIDSNVESVNYPSDHIAL